MKKTLLILILLFLSVSAFCQYGNMSVIEVKDLPFCSENSYIDGVLHFTKPGYIGVFVRVLKPSKVKITVSAKGIIKYHNYPTLRYVCDNQSTWKEIRNEEDYEAHSVNFDLLPGIHFIKVENMPFLNTNYPKREIFIERVYVSGNDAKYVDKVDDSVILEACYNCANDKKKEIMLQQKGEFRINKTEFDWGLLAKRENLQDFEFVAKANKNYDFIVNEESENYPNTITENVTSAYVTSEDNYAVDFRKQLEELRLNKVDVDSIRFTYMGEGKKEDLRKFFSVLQTLTIYGIPVQVYDLYDENKENLENLVTVATGVRLVRGIVFSEKSPVINRENLDIFQPVFVEKVNSKKEKNKYKYKAFPGDYIVNTWPFKVE